jgi:hypothetical protein
MGPNVAMSVPEASFAKVPTIALKFSPKVVKYAAITSTS